MIYKYQCWTCAEKFVDDVSSCPSCSSEIIITLVKMACVDCGNIFRGQGGDYCNCPGCDGETREIGNDKSSIGMKDKNGQEICEGDIFHLGDENIRYKVVSHSGEWCGKNINCLGSYVGIMHWLDRVEVQA